MGKIKSLVEKIGTRSRCLKTPKKSFSINLNTPAAEPSTIISEEPNVANSYQQLEKPLSHTSVATRKIISKLSSTAKAVEPAEKSVTTEAVPSKANRPTTEAVTENPITEKAFSSTMGVEINTSLESLEYAKDHSCNVCGQGFQERTSLKKHMSGHTSMAIYGKFHRCRVCQKTFSGLTALRLHIPTHKGEEQYQCHLCEKKFFETFEVNLHVRLHHGMKIFKCTKCDKTFETAVGKFEHMKSHKARRQCFYCDKHYSTNNYGRHVREVHKKERDKSMEALKRKRNDGKTEDGETDRENKSEYGESLVKGVKEIEVQMKRPEPIAKARDMSLIDKNIEPRIKSKSYVSISRKIKRQNNARAREISSVEDSISVGSSISISRNLKRVRNPDPDFIYASVVPNSSHTDGDNTTFCSAKISDPLLSNLKEENKISAENPFTEQYLKTEVEPIYTSVTGVEVGEQYIQTEAETIYFGSTSMEVCPPTKRYIKTEVEPIYAGSTSAEVDPPTEQNIKTEAETIYNSSTCSDVCLPSEQYIKIEVEPIYTGLTSTEVDPFTEENIKTEAEIIYTSSTCSEACPPSEQNIQTEAETIFFGSTSMEVCPPTKQYIKTEVEPIYTGSTSTEVDPFTEENIKTEAETINTSSTFMLNNYY